VHDVNISQFEILRKGFGVCVKVIGRSEKPVEAAREFARVFRVALQETVA
jgi:hypothetical protein